MLALLLIALIIHTDEDIEISTSTLKGHKIEEIDW